MIRANLGCANDPGCGCSNRMADAADGSFQSWLEANPDQAAALAAYQLANQGDPSLQPVMYNPVTQVYGPVNLPVQAGFGSGLQPPAAGNSNNWLLLTGAVIGAAILFSSGGKRR